MQIWMASCTSGLTHIKKTMKMNVIDSNNLINIRVSHSELDYLVTDFVTFLCLFVFIRFIMYFMLQRDFFSKSSKCGLAHLCLIGLYAAKPICSAAFRPISRVTAVNSDNSLLQTFLVRSLDMRFQRDQSRGSQIQPHLWSHNLAVPSITVTPHQHRGFSGR